MVLVILAILAAAIIPSMMGFIDRAKQESVAAEQRSVLLAAQVRAQRAVWEKRLYPSHRNRSAGNR